MPSSLTQTDSNARAAGKGGERYPCYESNEVVPNHGRVNAFSERNAETVPGNPPKVSSPPCSQSMKA